MLMISPLCSASCLATLLDLSKSRVHQLARLGIIKKVCRGQYDLLASLASYVVYLRAQAPCKKHAQRSASGGDSLVWMLRKMASLIRHPVSPQEPAC